jgi:hypothetical protein
MSATVRHALWDYTPGTALTAVCDADVDGLCPKVCGGWWGFAARAAVRPLCHC